MADALDIAARNNAAWCDAICRAHGTAGVFGEHLWHHAGPTPRFYPSAITLTRDGAAEQHEAIAALASARSDGFGVKDSFATLDLAPLGFSVLFEAEWLRHALDAPAPLPAGLDWTEIRDAAALAHWETAWGGDPADPIFRPSLLADPSITFLAGMRQGTIVAGAALNRAAGGLGLSNLFLPEEDAEAIRAALIAEATHRANGLPVVGYESGETLAAFRRLGARPLGPLRIWVR